MRAPLSLALLMTGCVAHGPPRVNLGPLEDEVEVALYLAPLPPEARRLTVTVSAAVALNDRGVEVPRST